jgi:GNAT superfamily N-acetyltransferase
LPVTYRIADAADIERITRIDNLNRREQISGAVQHGECFDAEEAARIVGFAVMDYSFFDYGIVKLLITAEKHRRQGVGRSMIAYLFRRCKTEKLFVSTNESNAPVRGLLSKTGFVPCGRIDALDEGDPELFFVRRKIRKFTYVR